MQRATLTSLNKTSDSDYAPDPEDEGERSASEELQQSPKTPKSKLPRNAGSTESKRPLAARTPVTPKTPVTPRTPITPAYNSSRAAANLAKFSRTPSDVKVSVSLSFSLMNTHDHSEIADFVYSFVPHLFVLV